MSKQDPRKIQTCILKVNIHCDGCEQKVKKWLQKIDGVYSVSTDAEQGKVVVTGDVEPAKLINKLKRSGKHAEIWGGQRGMMSNQNYPINPKFQNLQGGKDNMSQNQKGQKGGGQLAQFQNIKGPQDLKVPTTQHKSVKFNIPIVEFDDDNFDHDELEGHGHGNPMMNNMMPVLGNGSGPNGPAGMMNVLNMNNHKGYDSGNYYGSTKKVDVIDMPMQVKGKGGNYNEVKNGNNGGMKSKVDLVGKNKKKEKHKGGGGVVANNYKKKNAKSEGGLLGRFLGFGKKRSKKGGVVHTNMNNTNKNNINVKEVKKGGEKLEGYSKKKNMSENEFDDYFDFDIPNLEENAKSGNGKGSNGNGNGTNVGQMGPMKQKDPMGQMENVPALNSGGGEYHHGMQMQPTPYNLQQQQHMAMMMNQQQQQQANMNNMYPPAMMHDTPYPSMPPPMPSHPMADPMTHVFSDENTQGYCNIM